MTTAHGDLDQTHASTSIHDTLGCQEHELIVTKRRISAFTGSDFDVLLRGYGADTLILTGTATSGAVLSTIRQSADLDFRLTVLSDACTHRDEEVHRLTVLSDACADRDEEVHRVLTQKVFPQTSRCAQRRRLGSPRLKRLPLSPKADCSLESRG